MVGFMFGPLLMAGVYYSACGEPVWPLLYVSVPVGLLVANNLYVHSMLDLEADKRAGKMTLAVLLKRRGAMLAALTLILFSPYLFVLAGTLSGNIPRLYMLVWLTLPMATGLFYLMIQFALHPEKRFSPAWWMGPMGRWDYLKKAGVDWFMIRWYLARNLLTFFCLITVIATLIR